MLSRPEVSVIIPACNEQAIITRTLNSITLQTFRGSAEVIVVVNGTNDRTSEIVARHRKRIEARYWTLTIVELSEASKVAALNVGDAFANGRTRIYLDADASLSPNAFEALSSALACEEPRLAAPKLVVSHDDGFKSRLVALIWAQIPPISDDVVGGGCYALNGAGRKRFGPFLDVIADDGFVRAHFARCERLLVLDASFTVPFPNDRQLVQILARWRHGNLELERMGLVVDDKGLLGRRLRALAASSLLWVAVPFFAVYMFRARRLAKRRFDTNNRTWRRVERATARRYD